MFWQMQGASAKGMQKRWKKDCEWRRVMNRMAWSFQKKSDVGKLEQNSFATSSCVHDRIKKQPSFQSLALNFSEGLRYALNS